MKTKKQRCKVQTNKREKDINAMEKCKLFQFGDKVHQKPVQLFPRYVPNQKYVLMVLSLNRLRCEVNLLGVYVL